VRGIAANIAKLPELLRQRSLPRFLWLRCHTKSDLPAEPLLALDTSEKWFRIATRPDEESQSWRTGGLQEGLPSASDPETEADRTPREPLLACMPANREPSNQGFEIDREATVCTASRRFLLFCGRLEQSGEPREVAFGSSRRFLRRGLSNTRAAWTVANLPLSTIL